MEKRKKLYYFLKAIFGFLIKLFYRTKVYGKENIPDEGRFILAGNHKHAFDPVLAVMYLKRYVCFFAKEEVSGGFHGFLMRKIGTIIVYKDRKKNVASIKQGEDILKNGGVIGIFPEGTRNRTDEILLKFRKGAVSMAKKTDAPIVPFAIRGKYKMFKKGLEVEYGKPIDISGMTEFEANEYLKNEVLKLLTK